MEFEVGTRLVQSAGFVYGSSAPDYHSEPPLSGFLNRKCVVEPGGRKSKDRSWQTFWCQLKGVSLEFHRVDGVKSEGSKPPPRDIFPPPHMPQHKAGFVSVDGATAEDDYTSQIGKDLQKRRSWLFELTLPNQMIYLLQAPNGTQRAQWIQHIRRAASGKGEDIESRKLKAARCSVRHRSRQNVLSLKGAQEMQGEGEEADLLTAVRGNRSAPLLQEMLRAKKDLLTKINRMYNSFLGDTQQLYSEEVRRTPSVAESLATPRRLSLPSPVFTSAQSLQQDSRQASMGAFFTTSSTPNSPSRANWSHLKQGYEVVLTGRLESGWFRCLAHTDVGATEEGMDIFPGYIHISDDNCDSLPDTPSPQLGSGDTPSPTPGASELSEGVTDMFISDPENTDKDTCSLPSCDQASESRDPDTRQSHDQSVVLQEESPRSMRVGRSYSYIAATQTNPESNLLGLQNARRSLDYSVIHKRKEERRSQEGVERQDSVGALEDLLSQLAKSNSRSFRFPLVGVVPPSVVKKVPEMSDLILVTPPVLSQSLSQSVSVVASSDRSPAHSLSLTESTYQSGEAHQQAYCSGTTPTHSVQPDTHTQSPLPTRMQEPSNSAPTTPLHTAVLSPVPTPSSTTPSNVEMSPNKLPISPLKSPRARRHVYEPVAAMLDNPFIKKFLPGKKPSKQKFLPDKLSILKTPTIEEEAPYSLSPSPAPPSPPHSPLPPPAMLEFSEQAMQADMRTRMSSFSGRPIKSTGICLQFGEDDSSSDSDRESITESDVPERLALSLRLPSTGGFAGGSIDSSPTETSGLLLPPPISPDILAPGNLRRAASAHGSLYVREENGEPATISPDTRHKSCSTHSLTSPIVRGLHNSFKKHHTQIELSPVPAKKRNSSKKKRQGSECEETEPESPKFGGIFRQPPTGQKRFVYLDPRQPKYGFRLESYGRPSGLGQEIQVFVQSVRPGSPAFMSGLFPGDTILEVNGVNVRSDPVATVVKRIQDCPRTSDKKVQLTVMFVDGVTRLERMKKTDHLRYQMKMNQAQLKVMISEESSHLAATSLPPTRNITPAADLEPWCSQTPSTGPILHLYPCDRALNEQVALSSVHPSQLASDVLVIPLCVDVRRDSNNVLTRMVMDGGSELLDELCLAAYCPLGECIITRGYLLPAHSVFHCVFGDMEENLQQCMQHALDNGCTNKTGTITFWLDGFTAVNVCPHSVIECVRLWLEQEGNNCKYTRIIFSAETNGDFTKTVLERYFPLAHYYFSSQTPENVRRAPRHKEDDTPTSGEDSRASSEYPQETKSSVRTLLEANYDDTLLTREHASSSSPSTRTLNAQRMESDV